MENNLDIKAIFKDALNQTISNYAETAKLEIGELVLNICGRYRPYMLVTKSGAEIIADEIFLSSTKRDFIFNLLFNFCPRLSFENPNVEFSKLITGLTFSLAICEKVNKEQNKVYVNIIPNDISDRLSDNDIISNLLNDNKWLVIVLLISLYITVDDFQLPDNKSN